jgi:RES domain-containing protein
MTKKEYQKPAMLVMEAHVKQQILAASVQTTGLGDELTQDDTPGDSWSDAMSRQHSAWDDDEEEW